MSHRNHTTTTTKAFDEITALMAYEAGELSQPDTLRLFQHLVDTGLAWKLQGHYGRTAQALINAGHIAARNARSADAPAAATPGNAATSPRFPTGRIVITANAQRTLAAPDVSRGLSRHIRGDWGELCEEDRRENELSLKQGFRLLSAYRAADGCKFWIITEADRSVTTVLLPEDY